MRNLLNLYCKVELTNLTTNSHIRNKLKTKYNNGKWLKVRVLRAPLQYYGFVIEKNPKYILKANEYECECVPNQQTYVAFMRFIRKRPNIHHLCK